MQLQPLSPGLVTEALTIGTDFQMKLSAFELSPMDHDEWATISET